MKELNIFFKNTKKKLKNISNKITNKYLSSIKLDIKFRRKKGEDKMGISMHGSAQIQLLGPCYVISQST